MSKRPALGALGSNTEPNRCKQLRVEEGGGAAANEFTKLLEQAGMKSSCSGRMVCPDIMKFRRTIERALITDQDRAQSFIEAMPEALSEAVQLRQHLLPTATRVDTSGSQDSPIRILLSIKTVQKAVVELIVSQLFEHIDDDTEGTGNITWLLLSQLRWMDTPVAEDSLSQQLIELIGILTGGLQHETIRLLPEILSANSHHKMVNCLLEVVMSEVASTRPVLEALSCFELNDEYLEQVVSAAVQLLDSAELEDVPCIVRFLINKAPTNLVGEVVRAMRCKLNINEMEQDITMMQSQVSAAQVTSEKRDLVGLVLEAVRHGLAFRPQVCSAFLDAMRQSVAGGAEAHSPVDVWVLLVASTIPTAKKAVVKLFKAKVASAEFSAELLRQAVLGARAAVSQYCAALLGMAEQLARSVLQPAHRLFSCEIYTLCFSEFDDSCQHHEVLALLMSHVGSGVSSEIKVALDTLLRLLKSAPTKERLRQLKAHISAVLDYVECFEHEHTHKVFTLFCELAEEEDAELHILVRKYLASHEHHFKQVGIVGALALVGSKCLDPQGAAARSEVIPRSTVQQTIQVLEMAFSSCKEDRFHQAFLFDTLATLLERSNPAPGPLVEWLGTAVTETFMKYVDCMTDDQKVTAADICGVIDELRFSIDGKDASIAVALAGRIEQRDQLLPLFSHFRAMCALELATEEKSLMENPLAGLDAFLGCPLHCVERLMCSEFADLSSKSQRAVCDVLYASVSWCREIISSFSIVADKSIEVRGKLITRLEHLLSLEEELAAFAGICAEWSPVSQFALSDPTEVKLVKKKPKKDDAMTIAPPSDAFKKHYRRLEPRAIRVLLGCVESGGITLDVNDTEGAAPTETILVTAQMAQRLLCELQQQLQHTLRKATRSATPWGAMVSKAKTRFGASESPPEELCSQVGTILPSLRRLVVDHADNNELIRPLCECMSELYTYASSLSEGTHKQQLVEEQLGGWALRGGHLTQLFDDAFEFFWGTLVAPEVLDVETVLHVLALFASMVSLATSCEDCEAAASLGSRSSEAACKLLISPRSSSADPAQLIVLVKHFVRLAPEPLLALKTVVDQILITLRPEDAPEGVEMFAVAHCNSLLPVFFKVATEQLSGLLATQTVELEKARTDGEAAQLVLNGIQTALLMLRDLTSNAKHASEVEGCKQREVLSALLRHGKPIVQVLQKLLPELGHHVVAHKQMVTSLIKVMQKSTRSFHTFCGVAKESRDDSLMKLVPPIKRGLESLINKARAFVDNNQNHFNNDMTIGILKNRNMAGDEICSQIFVPRDQQDADEEDEEDDEEGEEGEHATAQEEEEIPAVP